MNYFNASSPVFTGREIYGIIEDIRADFMINEYVGDKHLIDGLGAYDVDPGIETVRFRFPGREILNVLPCLLPDGIEFS
jgi:hypothetical protein